ncbi:MAG: dehydrogenase [Roseateles sp.]|nr:MAG: dehydrogenase [Roseateles sp.]
MPHLLLIIEPPGQRAARGRAAGEQAYARMLAFGAELQAQGLLLTSHALGTAARRLQRRDGQTTLTDGPFAEAKEMVGGFFLLDTEDAALAQAWAERCPAAEWATVEIRGVGPCYL